MTPHLELFLTASANLGLERSSWVYTDTPNHRLTLTAPTGFLSPIVVHDDGNEFIVDLGVMHHTHFHGSRYPDGTDVSGAATDAARFVQILLSDRVCVTVHYVGGRCTGSSHFFLDTEDLTPDTVGSSRVGIYGGNIRTERYLWSGAV